MARRDQAPVSRGSREIVPRVGLPRLPGVPKNPAGWNLTEIVIRRRGGFPTFGGGGDPAGDPPASFLVRYPGATKPEWAVYWGLLRSGKQDGVDFQVHATLPGVEAAGFSQVDFYLPELRLGIEVQGDYWHYQTSERTAVDSLRAQQFSAAGTTIIFIDESDAIQRPEWAVAEALAGRDHSRIARQR